MEIHKSGLGQQTTGAGPETSFSRAKVYYLLCYSECAFSLFRYVFKVVSSNCHVTASTSIKL